ncbi:PAS domain-containing protein [Ideonella sp. B7]|uniref:hybrid sensor histidine kinase/response regulator n=1 Tax=Ideonella benzenivorans TaxID=2831643 RepID=UPI001CED7DC0|nr:ATP-binding protein [Ideonella benzenivorans]MCA6216285.1 PAS domain-containing protein [Ideonella benzenivorans]
MSQPPSPPRTPPASDAAAPPTLDSRLINDLAGIIAWQLALETRLLTTDQQGYGLLGTPTRPGGWPAAEFTARVHPDDLESLREANALALATHGPVDATVRVRGEDGRWVYLLTRRVVQCNAEGHPTVLQGIAFNVTQQQRLASELKAASERIALAARGVGMGTWVLDVATQYQEWDPQMWQLRGLSPRPVPPTGDELLAMVHPDDRPSCRARQDQHECDRDRQHEFRVVWPDGSVHWLASRMMVVRDEHGQPLQEVGVNWDVTDTHQALAERHARELAQRESEAKSELLARLSHELRTPLNAVLGFTQLLLADHDRMSAVERQKQLQQIEHAGVHLLSLINDVLELARPEDTTADRPPLQPVPLAEVLGTVLPMVEAAARQHQLSWRLDVPVQLQVQADPVRLRQVLLNLLTNAVKYNRDGGWIEVRARQEGDQAVLQVSDSGVGIAPQDQASAFEPFRRLPSAAEVDGVGIGLAIVKTLVRRMGGEIRIDSQPGVGSTFEIRLAAGEPAPASPEPLAPPAAEANATPCLLYIEDNPVNMTIVAELVARHPGIRFVGADDAQTGLRLARELQPRLILTDMQLPDLHGHEVLARLRADPATRDIPCIALSANALPNDIEAALAQGFSAYWTKPLDFSAFRQTLSTLFGSIGR